jgi:phosphoribosylformylglycinamidine synthase
MTANSKTIGVVRFPGTNCDRDVMQMVTAKGLNSEYLWHQDRFDEGKFEALIIPGGFSYGDYLRSGALAARSPVMTSVRSFIDRGGPVLGICNGFQILTEAGLLPGALLKNKGGRFIDSWAELSVANPKNFWSKNFTAGALRLPVAHGDGRFHADAETLKRLHGEGQVWLKYKTNLNGSLEDIAGVTNSTGRVAALMPHPERALFDWMGGTDGWNFL